MCEGTFVVIASQIFVLLDECGKINFSIKEVAKHSFKFLLRFLHGVCSNSNTMAVNCYSIAGKYDYFSYVIP